MSLYTEPLYLQASPTTALLSDTRPTSLSPSALSALNATLDELLQLFIHASLIAPTGASPPSVNGTPPLSAGPLGPKDVYTTERFAAGVRRVLGPNLGKNVVLEAELAIRELLRMGAPSLRGDGALRKGSFSGTVGVAATTQADDLFRLLREWVMEISGLGAACPPTGPMTLTNHLLALTPPPPPPLGTMSPQLTFLNALYAERCLFFLGDYLARAVGRVTERGQNESASLLDVEAAFAEDNTIWSWLQGLRVRGHIEAEIATLKSKQAGSVSHSRSASTGSPTLGGSKSTAAPSIAASRKSQDTTLTYGTRRDRQGSTTSTFGLGIVETGGETFEQLMQSGKTMKVSLTPDRLRTADPLGTRPRPQSNVSNMSGSASMPSLRDPASPTSSVSGSVRRFQARPAVGAHGIIDEREEDSAANGGRTNGDSLFALLNSPPTWANEDESRSPTSPPRKRSAGKDPFHPMSVAMRAQHSHNSVQTVSSTMSSESDVDAWLKKSPKARQVHLKAKDERKDLAHERQINHDLADFFSNSPPPPPVSSHPSWAPPPVREDDSPTPPGTASPVKKGKKSFSSLFGSRTSKKSPESEDGGLGRSESIMSKSTTSSMGRKTSRTRLNSNADPTIAAAAAMRAAGFSDAAIRTASYSPPPNLAPSPSLDSKHARRASQASVPPVPPIVEDRRSSIPARPSNKSLRSTGSSETEVAHRYSSSNGHPRHLAPALPLATITTPPATLAEERLAPQPPTKADPSPHLSIAPTFQTARDEPEEASPAPTQQSKLGGVAGAGLAALAGAAGVAAATVLRADKDAEDKQERPSTEEDRSTPLPSGIAMASQELGYRSSNDTLNRDPRAREASASTISTSAPSAPTTLDSLAPMRDASGSSAQKANGIDVDDEPDSSSTLLSLKTRMAAASTPAECVALLEAFMAQQRERKDSQASSVQQVEDPVIIVNGDAVEDAEEEPKVDKEIDAAKEKQEVVKPAEQAAPQHKERMDSWLDQIVAGGGWSAFHAPKDVDLKVEEQEQEEIQEEQQAEPEPLDQFERRLSIS